MQRDERGFGGTSWLAGRLALAVGVVAGLGACATGALPAVTPSRESGQSSLMGQTFAGADRCSPDKHQRPFVIEWDATDMSSFEARAAKDVIVVRYEGCDLQVLDSCVDDSVHGSLGSYKAVEWTSGSLEKIDIADEAELAAKLPLGVATLGGRVQAGESFHMEYYVSGTRAATRASLHRAQLDQIPGCKGATHFVYAYNLGAFGLASTKSIEGGVDGSAFGFGAGAKRGHASSAEKKGGELAACRGVMAKEVQSCKVPIRLTLREIADGEDEDVAASKAAEGPEAKNLAGKLLQKGERADKANELRQSAMRKFFARDGKGCLADLDAADRLDPKHPSTDPNGYLRTRGGCVMLSGHCDAGKRMVRQSIQATLQNMSAEMVDNVVEGDAGSYCQGGSLSPRDQVIKAANDINKMHMQHVDAATCRKAYDTLRRLLPTVKPNGEDDSQYNGAARTLFAAATCFVKAGDCATGRRVWSEVQNPPANLQPAMLAAFDGDKMWGGTNANVTMAFDLNPMHKSCKGK